MYKHDRQEGEQEEVIVIVFGHLSMENSDRKKKKKQEKGVNMGSTCSRNKLVLHF